MRPSTRSAGIPHFLAHLLHSLLLVPCVGIFVCDSQDGALRTLGQVQALLGKSLSEMAKMVDEVLHAEPYSKTELAGVLGLTVAGRQNSSAWMYSLFCCVDLFPFADTQNWSKSG